MSPAVVELPSGLCRQSAGRDSYRRGRLPEYSLRWIMSCFLAVFLFVIETRTGRDPTGQRAPFPQPKLVPNLLSSRYLLGKFGREGFSGNPTQSRPGLTVPPVTCWVFVVFFLPSPLLPVPQLCIAPLRDGQLPVAVSLQHPLAAGGGDPVVWEGKPFWLEECRRATQQSRPAESLRAVN